MLNYALKNISLSRIMSYYAVARGREVGVYETWAKAEQQVKGYKGAVYKKFPTRSAANEFITEKKGSDTSYFPRDLAVPLGSTLKKEAPLEVKKDDFWPDSDGDSFNETDLSDGDLVKAMIAFEREFEENGKIQNPLKRKASNALPNASTSKMQKMQSKIWEPVSTKQIAGSHYSVDEEGYVIVYTDGSCFNNGQKNACAGFGVYFGDNHHRNMGLPVKGRVTNNVGEIQAAIHAIKVAHEVGIDKLCISTDSQFLIKSITWMTAWKRKDWRLKNGDTVKNVVDFKELDKLLQRQSLSIKWNYVKAHKGIKGNEMADRLARDGSTKYKELHRK